MASDLDLDLGGILRYGIPLGRPAKPTLTPEETEALRSDFACTELVLQANCTDTPYGIVVNVDHAKGTFTVALP